MDVKNIPSDIDLKLNLLSGDSLFSDNIEVKPFTLREIKNIGFTEYMKQIGTLTIDKKSLVGDDESLNDYSLFEIVIISENEFLVNTFLDALSLLLREDRNNVLVNKLGFIFNGQSLNPEESKIVDKNIFNDITQMIKYQNCMVDAGEIYARPVEMSEKARRIMEKVNKAKAKITEIRQKESQNNIDFFDIVSAVSTKSNTYNKHNVWDLTLFQLYDEYKRLEAISSYDISIMAMTQGAKIDNLKHWSAKIQD